jgi:hypothetical protein
MKHLLVIALLAAAVAAPPLAAQRRSSADDEESFDRRPARCLSLPSVRQTEVIDDRTILFFMGRNRIYRNELPLDCPELKSMGRFSTNTRSTRLCNTDTVQPIRFLSAGNFPGAYCRLGDFYPITREEAELIQMDPSEKAAVSRSVVLTPIDPEEDIASEPVSGAEVGAGEAVTEIGEESE